MKPSAGSIYENMRVLDKSWVVYWSANIVQVQAPFAQLCVQKKGQVCEVRRTAQNPQVRSDSEPISMLGSSREAQNINIVIMTLSRFFSTIAKKEEWPKKGTDKLLIFFLLQKT